MVNESGDLKLPGNLRKLIDLVSPRTLTTNLRMRGSSRPERIMKLKTRGLRDQLLYQADNSVVNDEMMGSSSKEAHMIMMELPMMLDHFLHRFERRRLKGCLECESAESEAPAEWWPPIRWPRAQEFLADSCQFLFNRAARSTVGGISPIVRVRLAIRRNLAL